MKPRKSAPSLKSKLLNAGNAADGKLRPDAASIDRKVEAAILVQEGKLLIEAAEKTGLDVSTIRKFIQDEYYTDLVRTYTTRLQVCQEKTLQLMERGLESLASMQSRMASGTWLEEAEPDRINAMANLLKVTSDSTFRLIDAANRAQGRISEAAASQGQLPAAATD